MNSALFNLKCKASTTKLYEIKIGGQDKRKWETRLQVKPVHEGNDQLCVTVNQYL